MKRAGTRSLSLSLNKKAKKQEPGESSEETSRSARFSIATEEESSAACQGVVPTNTKNSNDWAMRNLREWMAVRAKSDEPVPEDLLSCSDPTILCKWLCRFVLETRKLDGTRYPASSIRSLLSAFQRILQSNKLPYRLFDTSDTRFTDLRNTLDTVSVSLRKDGIGTSRVHAAVITREDEESMWASGVVGLDNPWSLVRAVFVISGLHFSLRGGSEHHDLVVDQFKRFPSGSYDYDENSFYEYTERGSKNYQGKFSDSDANKVCRVYAQVGSNRCPVLVLDTYFKKLPPNPKAFYLQPLQKVSKDRWFMNSAIGVNPLKSMMPKISVLANLSQRYTNHSLRATAASRMFSSGVPEKVIAERTGHRSMKGLRQYERTSVSQIQAAGLAVAEEKQFSSENTSVVHEGKQSGTKEEKPSTPLKDRINKMMPTFAGSMNNCTININL